MRADRPLVRASKVGAQCSNRAPPTARREIHYSFIAEPNHLQTLRRGVKAWIRWREENPDVIPDLSGTNRTHAYLTRANLSHANLRRVNFAFTNVVCADFDGADLRGANLLGIVGLVQKQLDSAIGDDKTRIPLGLRRPVGWTKSAEQ